MVPIIGFWLDDINVRPPHQRPKPIDRSNQVKVGVGFCHVLIFRVKGDRLLQPIKGWVNLVL
jgi:hypothetical protein